MGWVSGTPNVPMGVPGDPPEGSPAGGGWRAERVPSAWVPPTARLHPEGVQRARVDALVLIVAGTGYLILAMVLLLVAALQGGVDPTEALPRWFLFLLVEVALLGWLGLTASGLLLHLLAIHVGIPYRPPVITRGFLVAVNAGLLGTILTAPFSLTGPIGALHGLFLFVVAVAYLVFAGPLLLSLLSGLQDWRSGGGL